MSGTPTTDVLHFKAWGNRERVTRSVNWHEQVRRRVCSLLKWSLGLRGNHLPGPKDEVTAPATGKVISLMDAFIESIEGDAKETVSYSEREPCTGAKELPNNGIGLVKRCKAQ
jgi:hypothetical protein